MTTDFSHWVARPRPDRRVLDGRYVRLEPLNASTHGDALFSASTATDAAERFRWLPEVPPSSRAEFDPWLRRGEASEDPIYYAVVDVTTGLAVGRQTLMRIDAANGVAEVGNIYWGPAMARTRSATEALYLFMLHVFDDLGYRRFEWKCNDENTPSKRAAHRFGFSFEGRFRQHMVVKGRNRDTAWFAMIDADWPALKSGYSAWLEPENFDDTGVQKRPLSHFIPEPARVV